MSPAATVPAAPGAGDSRRVGIRPEWRGTSPVLTEASARDAWSSAQPCLATYLADGETPRRLAKRIGLHEHVLFVLNKNVLTLRPYNPATGLGDDDGRWGLEQPVRERGGMWLYVPPTIPALETYQIRALTAEELRAIHDAGFACSADQISARLAAAEQNGLIARGVR